MAASERDPFVMSTIIPNGTKVTAQDDKPIEYEWLDGKIVKSINQSVVDGASSTDFVAPRRARRWLWATIAAAATFGVILVWRAVARRRA